MNNTLRPEGLPFDTPEISPLLADDVGGLPPQLVYWSPHEILATDASRWIERSVKAGVKICEHKGEGQLHTYSLGWPFVGRKLQDECDELLFEFIFDYVKPR
jgi:acetyl esterase/lipase